jgi:prepilin-type processing-associated H-X9-DG protein
MLNSPLWKYTKTPAIFKCPADQASVTVQGQKKFRPRSNSMSQVFGNGEWLDGAPSSASRGQANWHVYIKLSGIHRPASTFVLVDEHPDSINDAAFAVACAGADTTSARIIDFPASFHGGAAGFSFADGHSEIKKWKGPQIRKAPVTYTGTMALNVLAASDADREDVRWMALNTTVKK